MSEPVQWGKVIDQTRCIGCHACSTACKSENAVPLGVNRTYVKYVDIGQFPTARRAFQVTRCNQCEHPPCVEACPTTAMYRRPDGIVDFDKNICIGCKACIAACPYDAIFINPEDHSAEKCNFCAHRLEVGLEPACVVVCPTEAILIGNLKDPESRVAKFVNRDVVAVRRPEKETLPKLFYKGAHQATLDPLAAQRPEGGIFMWSEQGGGLPHEVISGHPGQANNVAAAMLAYDVPHRAPWGLPVSAYVWTKAIAAGSYLVAASLVLLGRLDTTSVLWKWTTPLVSAIFLAITFILLIADLEHPSRFYMILTRPQWRSWIVRGAVILTGFSAVLGAHLLWSFLGNGPPRALAFIGALLAIASGTYTAWLFAQAKARDFWQSPLLPLQHLIASVLAGAAALVVVASYVAADYAPLLAGITAGATVVHLVLIAAEVLSRHPTAHARLAAQEMVRGRFRIEFAAGVILQLLGLINLPFRPEAAVIILLGLLLYEHAHVGAGQAVPLA
ncbi:MAG TPA: 4Fe-4S dicluster domain-containing protein [Thermoanaerobaculia bacterium]|jgi:Fe-S-cluster-containing dehydrogenase component/formate-dependent nitrite reductase membrane component NrfD|nr:4Fe-4S dicluster domain-containing protein [Thermoanaerobaculia bacterium]